jgi:protein SCO1/2
MMSLFQLAAVLSALGVAPALADPPPLPASVRPAQLEGVGIEEHLNREIDQNLTFIAEDGYPVRLGDYFHKGRPVILNLIYYSCPMLCNLILNGQTEVLKQIPWTPGNEFEIVTISFDPSESFDLARKKKAVYLSDYGRPAPGWHFLTDNEGNAKRLADLVGFKYRYDERQGQFAHPAGILILTPEAKVARYLYGVRYRPMDVRFALTEAAANRSTFSVERVLLFCYHYDPTVGSYVLFASNFMRAGGVLTVILIAFFLWRLFREDRKKMARWKEGLA